MEFNRDVARAIELEDAGWTIAVERDLAVRVVIHEKDAVVLTKANRILEVLTRRDRGRRVVRIIQVQDARALYDVFGNLIQRNQEIIFRAERHRVRLAAR